MSFRNTTLTVTRFISQGFVKGQHVPASDVTTTFDIKCSLQPIGVSAGKSLISLPENVRESATFSIYTDTELQTVNEANSTKADRVVISGRKYDVILVQPWQNDVINHFKVIVGAIDGQP